MSQKKKLSTGNNLFNRISFQLKSRRTVRRLKPTGHGTVCIILNPAAGKDRPMLKTMNQVFKEAGIRWELVLTKTEGDGKRLAKKAAAAGFDVVAVYGGDGTIAEVAGGLLGTGIPLGIIPGGTANMMAMSLNIPRELRLACQLIASEEHQIRVVDIGVVENNYFLQLVGIGMEAKIIQLADRDLKDRLGPLAYGWAIVQALHEPHQARFFVTLDGEERIEMDGVTCLIANGNNVNFPNLGISMGSDPDDGLLEIGLLRQTSLDSLINMASSITGGPENQRMFLRRQARTVFVEAEPQQMVQADGEIIGHTPVKINIIPQAVRVIVPPSEV